jgi:hydrogenase expression/formation protein HypE
MTHYPSFECPVPLKDYPRVILGHGGGGKLTAELIEHLFLPAFGRQHNQFLSDSTTLQLPGSRIALTTDSYVVQPIFFPGGSIGHLAVNGTVNDLAMAGAEPLYLTAGFILEEGLEIEKLARVVHDMAAAAGQAGVAIVAGDTKVVSRGHGDGCYINTSGVGLLPAGIDLSPRRPRPGDVVLLSGSIGDHGMAVMSVREGLEFESPIVSDSAALHGLVRQMLEVCPTLRTLRDPTRGGIAACLNEMAQACDCGIVVQESSIPVLPAVQAACEFLGLDPMMVANEGKLVAIAPRDDADRLLEAMRNHPLGARAARIGQVVEDPNRLVVAKTALGADRIVSTPLGEQLPRFC